MFVQSFQPTSVNPGIAHAIEHGSLFRMPPSRALDGLKQQRFFELIAASVKKHQANPGNYARRSRVSSAVRTRENCMEHMNARI